MGDVADVFKVPLPYLAAAGILQPLQLLEHRQLHPGQLFLHQLFVQPLFEKTSQQRISQPVGQFMFHLLTSLRYMQFR